MDCLYISFVQVFGCSVEKMVEDLEKVIFFFLYLQPSYTKTLSLVLAGPSYPGLGTRLSLVHRVNIPFYSTPSSHWSHTQGDVAETAKTFFEKSALSSPAKSSTLTLAHVCCMYSGNLSQWTLHKY